MNADEALKYVFQDSDFSVYQILKFPFGLLASCIYTHHEESEYWLFNETNYKFIAQTGTLTKLNVVEHCISKNGYMATWQSHAYDSNVDISIYKLIFTVYTMCTTTVCQQTKSILNSRFLNNHNIIKKTHSFTIRFRLITYRPIPLTKR